MHDHCLYCDAPNIPGTSWSSLFFPKKESALCKSCLKKLERIQNPSCEKCGRSLKKLAAEFRKDQLCNDCFRWEQDPNWQNTLERNISTWTYNDFLKEIIAQYKFRGDYELAKVFSVHIQSALQRVDYDMATTIPLSNERLHERGFNQSEALAEMAGIPIENLLIRIHSEKQSKKTRKERIAQRPIFQLAEKSHSIKGKKILIIDDIYTTGTTIRHAAKILKKAGAKAIISYTVARG